MDTNFISFINEQKAKFLQMKDKLYLTIVANKGSSAKADYVINQTMDAIIRLCDKFEIEYKFYLDENEFIKDSLLSPYCGDKIQYVYNRSIRGPLNSRRLLIPAFCNFNNIPYLGNNAYQMGLLCNKFHYYSLLRGLNIPIADYWCYYYKTGWLTSEPISGCKVIAKLVNENNATSLSDSSVFIYSKEFEQSICKLSEHSKQPVVLQKFVHGYEITIPVFISNDEVYVPEIIGSKIDGDIKFGKRYLNESILRNRIQTDYNEKYYLFSEINPTIVPRIKKDVEVIVKTLGIRSFTRFDLRIDDSFSYYFNDLGSVPGMLPGSSYAYLYDVYGFSYEDFLITTIMIDL